MAASIVFVFMVLLVCWFFTGWRKSYIKGMPARLVMECGSLLPLLTRRLAGARTAAQAARQAAPSKAVASHRTP
jgi:hypothetical protein